MTINPRVDFVFKKLFSSEENKSILIAFINAVRVDDAPIVDVTILNPYNQKSRMSDKESILDVKAVDEMGRYYNIEMQVSYPISYHKRALYYWAKLYTEQLKAGAAYKSLNKTISIHVLNVNVFKSSDYHNLYKILNVKDHAVYEAEDLELHFIELNKFNEDIHHIKTALDRWANFLKKANHYKIETLPPVMREDEAIVKAMSGLEKMSMDNKETELYEARLKWLRDEVSSSQKFEIAYEEGLEKGTEKGRVEGFEKGADRTKTEIAQAMLKEGLNLEQIAKLTGLTMDELKTLSLPG